MAGLESLQQVWNNVAHNVELELAQVLDIVRTNFDAMPDPALATQYFELLVRGKPAEVSLKGGPEALNEDVRDLFQRETFGAFAFLTAEHNLSEDARKMLEVGFEEGTAKEMLIDKLAPPAESIDFTQGQRDASLYLMARHEIEPTEQRIEAIANLAEQRAGFLLARHNGEEQHTAPAQKGEDDLSLSAGAGQPEIFGA